MKVIQSRSSEETQNMAKGFAKKLSAGSVLALVGDLGAGKTCFVKGLAEGLDIPKEISISSPTYVLIHEYPKGRLPLYHFDFYRLQHEKEVTHLNLEEYFDGKGISVVEWADHFPNLFPKRTQWIRFKWIDETTREIQC